MEYGNAHRYDLGNSTNPPIGTTERCPLGLPHSSTRDDVYKGFFIPKGTFSSRLYILLFVMLSLITWTTKGSIVVANAWYVDCLLIGFPILRRYRAILHDPETYPDPEEFKPERFLNEDGSVREDPTLSLVFGVGKRICPGRHLVDSTVFIFTSSVLSTFNVTKAKDKNGNEIPVKIGVANPRRALV